MFGAWKEPSGEIDVRGGTTGGGGGAKTSTGGVVGWVSSGKANRTVLMAGFTAETAAGTTKFAGLGAVGHDVVPLAAGRASCGTGIVAGGGVTLTIGAG